MPLRDYERVMKSVADPTRVRILKLLEGGELCVCQINAVLGFKQSTISKHLALLRAAGLVKERKRGKWVHYSRDGREGSAYARSMLRALGGWLNDDPVVARDRAREAVAREIGPEGICERGMTLPAGRVRACCAAPPTGRNASTSDRRMP